MVQKISPRTIGRAILGLGRAFCLFVHMYTFSASLWIRSSTTHPGSWHFVTVPVDMSTQIRELMRDRPRRGWGAVRVEVQIAYMKWKTSIFPDKTSGSYLLPIKASVREELHIQHGDTLAIILRILE